MCAEDAEIIMSISRRHAIAGGLILPASTALGSQANSKVQVAALGTGNRGSYDTRYLAEDARVQVTAVCDINPASIDRVKTAVPAASQARVYKDAGELMAAGGFDAVLIATPVYMHPEHFELAARAGKHIYCEKPAGASVSGVKRLRAAAAAMKASQVVFFGFQQRFSPEYLAAEQLLRTGKLGELLLMRAEWMVGGIRVNAPKPSEEQLARMWYPWREKSGDFIVEQDCHGVDVLNWFAQAHPVSAIGGGWKGRRPYGNNLDHVNVTYAYPDGLPGYLHGTQLIQTTGLVREQIFGTLGSVETHRRYYEAAYPGKNPERVASKREITIDALEAFITHIVEGKSYSMANDACDATLTALLGRLAVDLKREVTWEELLRTA
jgi:predicted dehydrogenase